MTRKATIFAHNGQVTAIAFPGEHRNFQGGAVAEVEGIDQPELAAKLLALVPSGVGSPWPAIPPAPIKKASK